MSNPRRRRRMRNLRRKIIKNLVKMKVRMKKIIGLGVNRRKRISKI